MVNAKLEDLRKKAYVLYEGQTGTDLVNQEVKKLHKKEDSLSPEEEKAILNKIIRDVFIAHVGLERTKEFLTRDVGHVPGYHSTIEEDLDKVFIIERITFMKSLAILVAILLLVLVAYSGYYALSFNRVELCEGKKDIDGKDTCYLSLALNRANASFCRNLSTQAQKYNCFAQIGKKLNDSSLCESIPSDSIEYLDYHDNCLLCVAYTLKNASICDLFVNSIRRDECVSQLDRKISLAC